MSTSIRTEPPIAFFKELVDEAFCDHRTEPSQDSAHYLVQLLVRFVDPEGRYADVGPRPAHPLGELLLSAAHLRGSYERFVQLRFVGDMALFLSGFFAEHLKRRQVGASYYANLGEAAYGSAACTCEPSASAPIFEDLATNFAFFAAILGEVSGRCALDAARSRAERAYRHELAQAEVCTGHDLVFH